MSNVRVLNNYDIEILSLATLIHASMQPIVTNQGLSQSLIAELSSDISNDVLIELLNINLSGVWRTFSNDPTLLQGISSDTGEPIYSTRWYNQDWLYLPFQATLSSVKSTGEIVGGSISIQNYNKEIALATENPYAAIKYKLYIISKNTGECVYKDEYRYITGIVSDGVILQGETAPADNGSEPFPNQTYNKFAFK